MTFPETKKQPKKKKKKWEGGEAWREFFNSESCQVQILYHHHHHHHHHHHFCSAVSLIRQPSRTFNQPPKKLKKFKTLQITVELIKFTRSTCKDYDQNASCLFK